MILRPYQERLVSKAEKALDTHQNTLAVAATGAGKTIMLSALAGKVGGKTLVLQHRDELVSQNESKFRKVNNIQTSVVNAKDRNFGGQAVFSMVQTLSRHINDMPLFDHLIIDEAHHATANTYMRIIDHLHNANPKLLMSGFTATPARGDGFGLKRAGFTNCCGSISIKELVALGHLVQPKAYAIDLDGVDFSAIRKMPNGEFDMDQAAGMLDLEIHNRAIIEAWMEKAGDRRTVVFCSTISHAENICNEFKSNGVDAEVLTGETPREKRAEMLRNLDAGKLQVICNVAVLTEGWDCQTVSCVVLLRPCSFKSTMIQMIGRGLRTVDQDLYPGIEKEDCIILDFGQSLATHGDLLSESGISDRDKECPDCQSPVPPGMSECPICGYVWEPPGKGKKSNSEEDETLYSVDMMEIDVLNSSPFRWLDLYGSGKVMVAKGFDAAVFAVSVDGEKFQSFGRVNNKRMVKIQSGKKPLCLSAADDFLRMNESTNSAQKSKRWLRDPASQKQLQMLSKVGFQQNGIDLSITKYTANCHLAFQWNRRHIEKLMGI